MSRPSSRHSRNACAIGSKCATCRRIAGSDRPCSLGSRIYCLQRFGALVGEAHVLRFPLPDDKSQRIIEGEPFAIIESLNGFGSTHMNAAPGSACTRI
jgi:hypothetical protein